MIILCPFKDLAKPFCQILLSREPSQGQDLASFLTKWLLLCKVVLMSAYTKSFVCSVRALACTFKSLQSQRQSQYQKYKQLVWGCHGQKQYCARLLFCVKIPKQSTNRCSSRLQSQLEISMMWEKVVLVRRIVLYQFWFSLLCENSKSLIRQASFCCLFLALRRCVHENMPTFKLPQYSVACMPASCSTGFLGV